MMIRITLGVALLAGLAAAQSLDFQVYRTKVEPIFLKKRTGHARCVVCHSANNSAFRLQWKQGSTEFTEEESHKNFDLVSKLVKPGDPKASRLLIHPLSPEAGGDRFHGGGRQFASENDPDWKLLAEWVRGAK